MSSPTPTASPTGSSTGSFTARPSGSGSGTPATTPAESALLAAVQDALATEQQAAWGYPLLGPRVAADLVDLARTGDDAHTELVDTVSATLAGLGRTPVAAQVDYPLPSAVETSAQAAAYAAALEHACAAAWRYVVVRGADGTDLAGVKTVAVDALTAAAGRAARWRAVASPDSPTVAFPGT